MLIQVSLKVAKGQAKVVVATIATSRDYRLFSTWSCSPIGYTVINFLTVLDLFYYFSSTWHYFALNLTIFMFLEYCTLTTHNQVFQILLLLFSKVIQYTNKKLSEMQRSNVLNFVLNNR